MSTFIAILLPSSVAVAAKELGKAFGIDVLGTVSIVLIMGSAVMVAGAVLYSAAAALREEAPRAAAAAD